ncbi:MAG: DUF4868 domain-containing protein [Actinobacteria bacterium]|nr:DUF4868 domain-containing protein [Actinomycetota bacterium]
MTTTNRRAIGAAKRTRSAPSSRALTQLEALPDLASAGLRFVALGTDDTGDPWGRLLELGRSAATGLAEIATATRARLLDSTVIHYEPAALIPPGHVMQVAAGQAALLDRIQTMVDGADLEPFDARAEYAQSITMVAARFETDSGGVVTCYRLAEPLLRFRANRLFGLVRRGGRYDRIEAADMLLMRPDFDVVVLAGQAFFFRKVAFERAFGFLDELRQASAETFDQVTDRLRIDGLAELRAACTTQPQMMAKMASVRRTMDEDPDYAAAMTMPRLIAYVEAHPTINIEVAGTGADRRLVFDPSPARRWQIVKLLDDDFLHSVLTEREYEAAGKVRALRT